MNYNNQSDAWKSGYEDAMSEESYYDNPYDNDRSQWDAYTEGHNQGMRDKSCGVDQRKGGFKKIIGFFGNTFGR